MVKRRASDPESKEWDAFVPTPVTPLFTPVHTARSLFVEPEPDWPITDADVKPVRFLGIDIRTLWVFAIAYACGLLFLSAVAPAGDSKPKDSDPELVFSIPGAVAEQGTQLHIIHAAVMLSVFVLLLIAYRLTRERYVAKWTVAWIALMGSYAYMSVAGFGLAPPLSDYTRAIFSLVSSYFVLATGIFLVTPKLSPANELKLFLTACVLLIVPVVLLPSGISLGDSALSLAAVCCCASGLHRYLRALGAKAVYRGLVATPFWLYAAIQLGSPLLNKVPVGVAMYAAALVLKVGCGLTIVAVALMALVRRLRRERRIVEAQKETLTTVTDDLSQNVVDLNEARERLTKALERATASEKELSAALERTKISEEAASLRGRMYKDLSLVPEETTDVEGAIRGLLKVVCQCLRASHAVLYVPAQSLDTPSEFTVCIAGEYCETEGDLSRSMLSCDANRSIRVSPAVGVSTSLVQALAQGAMEVRCLHIDTRPSSPGAWIAVGNQRSSYPDDVRRVEMVKEMVTHLWLYVELTLSRDLLKSLNAARDRVGSAKTIQAALEAVQGVLAAALPCDNCSIIPALYEVGVDGPSNGRGASAQGDPYSVKFEQSRDLPAKLTAVVERAEGEVTGKIVCEGRPSGKDTIPFSIIDAAKVAAIAHIVAVVLERARADRNIETVFSLTLHEMRGGVGSLKNIVRWLGNRPESRSSRDIQVKLRDAETEVRTLSAIVSRGDIFHARRKEPFTDVSVYRDVVSGIAHRIRRELSERHPHLIVIIETDNMYAIPRMRARLTALNEIVTNLLENSVKYRQVGSGEVRIRIIGDSDAEYYLLRIQDWGIGIPEGWEHRIFELGQRAPNATTQSVKGQGLGLELSRRLAREFGGDLILGSREAPTEFIVKIPKKEVADDRVHR